jgi:hypothetical protein
MPHANRIAAAVSAAALTVSVAVLASLRTVSTVLAGIAFNALD